MAKVPLHRTEAVHSFIRRMRAMGRTPSDYDRGSRAERKVASGKRLGALYKGSKQWPK